MLISNSCNFVAIYSRFRIIDWHLKQYFNVYTGLFKSYSIRWNLTVMGFAYNCKIFDGILAGWLPIPGSAF